MKRFYTLVAPFAVLLLAVQWLPAQTNWPKSATLANGDEVKLYQWEPESLQGNLMKAKAAIALKEKDKTELVFGMAWLDADVRQTSDQVLVESASITALKIPGVTDENRLNDIQASLEDGLSQWPVSFASSDIKQQLQLHEQQQKLASNFNNDPPEIIYRNKPSLLVYIDGEPKFQHNKDWDMDAVINTPFTLVKGKDGQYYLYGNQHWFVSPAATGPYSYLANRPKALKKVEEAVKEAEQKNQQDETSNAAVDHSGSDVIPEIVVSTRPAELIQSDGEANFKPISGTSLLYVNNSSNDIFLDMNAQQYYLLLSGRWYSAPSLKGEWKFTEADQLPADFARIPEGSPKDNVLASVAGTNEADEARLDAQVPQTARVDRHNTEASVQYDGDPVFEDIDGLDVAYASNTASSVIRYRGRYYLVDNGIWFESYNATGPWEVAVERPAVVALIPARYPVYHMKYVYVYDVYPDYVYMGYTPGYLNTYVYGPTVVYGTGWYYRPWHRHYYYARPCTWGFGMHYNPWYGWSFGININFGWFNYGYPYYYGSYYGGPYWGGWWGPYRYRPSYCYGGYNYGRYYYGGYYGRYGVRNVTVINNYYSSSNIYRNRNGVVSRDYRRESFSNRTTAYRGRNGSANFNNNNAVRFERNRASNFNTNRARSEFATNRPTRTDRANFTNNPSNRSRQFQGNEREQSAGNGRNYDRGGNTAVRPNRSTPTPNYGERERSNPSQGTRRSEPQYRAPRPSSPPARQYEPRPSRPVQQSAPARTQPAPQRSSSPPSSVRPSRSSESRSGGGSSGSSSRGRRGG